MIAYPALYLSVPMTFASLEKTVYLALRIVMGNRKENLKIDFAVVVTMA
jgi:hypothetical protein